MNKLRVRRGTTVGWATTPIILDSGEPGYDVNTGEFKIGDGESRWEQLSSYLTYDEMVAALDTAVQQAIDAANIVDANDVVTMIDDHINDETPHPVYDDGPSLYLLYLNAKV